MRKTSKRLKKGVLLVFFALHTKGGIERDDFFAF